MLEKLFNHWTKDTTGLIQAFGIYLNRAIDNFFESTFQKVYVKRQSTDSK